MIQRQLSQPAEQDECRGGRQGNGNSGHAMRQFRGLVGLSSMTLLSTTNTSLQVSEICP